MIRRRTALIVAAAATLALTGCGAGTGGEAPTEVGTSAHGVDLSWEDFTTADEIRTDYTVHNGADEAMVITDRTEQLGDVAQTLPAGTETHTELEAVEENTAIISKRLSEAVGAGDPAPVFSVGRVLAPGDELDGTAIAELPLEIHYRDSEEARVEPTAEAMVVGDFRFCLGVIPLADLAEEAGDPATGDTVPLQQEDRAEQFTLCTDPEPMP